MGWNQAGRISGKKKRVIANDVDGRSVVGREGGFLETEKRERDWRIDKRRSFMAQ